MQTRHIFSAGTDVFIVLSFGSFEPLEEQHRLLHMDILRSICGSWRWSLCTQHSGVRCLVKRCGGFSSAAGTFRGNLDGGIASLTAGQFTRQLRVSLCGQEETNRGDARYLAAGDKLLLKVNRLQEIEPLQFGVGIGQREHGRLPEEIDLTSA